MEPVRLLGIRIMGCREVKDVKKDRTLDDFFGKNSVASKKTEPLEKKIDPPK